MSSISFYDACKIAAIKAGTSLPKLFKEMQEKHGFGGSYNYVYQILKGQRTNADIIQWFSERLKEQLQDLDYIKL